MAVKTERYIFLLVSCLLYSWSTVVKQIMLMCTISAYEMLICNQFNTLKRWDYDDDIGDVCGPLALLSEPWLLSSLGHSQTIVFEWIFAIHNTPTMLMYADYIIRLLCTTPDSYIASTLALRVTAYAVVEQSGYSTVLSVNVRRRGMTRLSWPGWLVM